MKESERDGDRSWQSSRLLGEMATSTIRNSHCSKESELIRLFADPVLLIHYLDRNSSQANTEPSIHGNSGKLQIQLMGQAGGVNSCRKLLRYMGPEARIEPSLEPELYYSGSDRVSVDIEVADAGLFDEKTGRLKGEMSPGIIKGLVLILLILSIGTLVSELS